MEIAPPWPEYPDCPCGCGVAGLKLQVRHARHLVGCLCPSCRGRRNKRKGGKANSRAHRRLGGTGVMVNDDIFHAYPMEHSIEVKTGAQIPAKLLTGLRSEWARHAFRQAAKKVPVGVQATPSIVLEVSPSEAYMVCDISGKERT